MIHIFIGTKAQYVKTAPVIHELEREGIPYHLIDSGQHADLSKKYRKFLSIREPDTYISAIKEDIKSVGGMLGWSLKFVFKIIFRPKYILHEIFKGQKGVCLIHGDTPTTLLSNLAAKRAGIKVAHLESGLRSFNLFHPFPEEIIRVWVMKISDFLFAPSQWAYDNLQRMGVKGECFNIEGNTNIDVLRFIMGRYPDISVELPMPYIVFSIHRVETILNKRRLSEIVDLAEKLSKSKHVVFCLHPPTEKQLKKYSLYSRLSSLSNMTVRKLADYPEFIQLIKGSDFIVTDGGSIQEESYYLGIPCLLMRNHTERKEGLDQNVLLSKFDETRINFFLDNLRNFRRAGNLDAVLESPSKRIVQIIKQKILEI